jgi:hypothetical protein
MDPLLQQVDCVQIPVPDLDEGQRSSNPLMLLDLSKAPSSLTTAT